MFRPSVDKLSCLWPRILDGPRFFGVGAADVVGINSFTLGMTQMSKFTAQLVRTLFERVLEIKKRLGGRMGSLATDEWYYGRINALDVRTLKVMVESGPWITREIGGEEVEVPMAVAATPEPVRRGLSLVS